LSIRTVRGFGYLLEMTQDDAPAAG